MKKREAVRVLNALRKIYPVAEAGIIPHDFNGICYNLQEAIGADKGHHFDCYQFLAEIFEAMGLDRSYPLGKNRKYPLYMTWLGGNLTLRLDLMSKVMTYIEIQLAIQQATYFGGRNEPASC